MKNKYIIWSNIFVLLIALGLLTVITEALLGMYMSKLT